MHISRLNYIMIKASCAPKSITPLAFLNVVLSCYSHLIVSLSSRMVCAALLIDPSTVFFIHAQTAAGFCTDCWVLDFGLRAFGGLEKQGRGSLKPVRYLMRKT